MPATRTTHVHLPDYQPTGPPDHLDRPYTPVPDAFVDLSQRAARPGPRTARVLLHVTLEGSADYLCAQHRAAELAARRLRLAYRRAPRPHVGLVRPRARRCQLRDPHPAYHPPRRDARLPAPASVLNACLIDGVRWARYSFRPGGGPGHRPGAPGQAGACRRASAGSAGTHHRLVPSDPPREACIGQRLRPAPTPGPMLRWRIASS